MKFSKILLSFGAAVVAAGAFGQITATKVGLPPGSTDFGWMHMSGDGLHVVGTTFVGGKTELVRWQKGSGFTVLASLPNQYSIQPSGVSADASTIVGITGGTVPNNQVPFVWTKSSGLQLIPIPAPYKIGSANAVSQDGLVVVGGLAVDGYTPVGVPFRWTAAGGTKILGNVTGGATSCNSDGSLVVGNMQPYRGYNQPFEWTLASNTVTPLNYNFNQPAAYMSPDGSKIFFSQAGGQVYAGSTTANAPLGPFYSGYIFSSSDTGDVLAGPSGVWTKYGAITGPEYLQGYGFTGVPGIANYRFTDVSGDGHSFLLNAQNGTLDSYVVTMPSIRPLAANFALVTPRNISITNAAVGGAAGISPKPKFLSNPAHAGFFQANPDGTFYYTPQIGFSGKDSFTYSLTASDGVVSNVGTATIYVQPNLVSVTASRPVVNNQANETQEVITAHFDGPIVYLGPAGFVTYSPLAVPLTTLPAELSAPATDVSSAYTFLSPDVATSAKFQYTLHFAYFGQPVIPDQTQSADVTVNPPQVVYLNIVPVDKTHMRATLELNHNAFTSPGLIHITSSNAAATVPATAIEFNGSYYQGFNVILNKVSVPTQVVITTKTNGWPGKSFTITVNP
jgi:hypothetical protein